MTEEAKIVAKLLEFSKSVEPEELFPALELGASEFARSNPFAFAMAMCIDRRWSAGPAHRGWTIPFYIKNAIGELDPTRINEMSFDNIICLLETLPQRPLSSREVARTIKGLASFVVKECNGDASRIWQGKTASQVKSTFQKIDGVGPGIANMAVLLLERAFAVVFNDRRGIDIKPDSHTVRVLYRLGLSKKQSERAAVETARRLNPNCPGDLDAALWRIGRQWCSKSSPRCNHCQMDLLCARTGL
jgi:endonuclease III